MRDLIEIALMLALMVAGWFLFTGDPSLIELWHQKAVQQAKQECTKS